MKLLIDCDPGHDDALALMLAHASGQEVIGITTVAGNVPLPLTTRNALVVRDLLGWQVPVHAGAATAIAGSMPDARSVHGNSGLDGPRPREPTRDADSSDAVGFIVAAAAAHADLWLLALGPLTNIAHALQRDPRLVTRIAGLSFMGGATAGGNVTPVAEFNIWSDPEAAAVVLAAAGRKRMCGLNLTHQVKSDDALMARLQRRPGVGAFAAQMLDFLHGRMLELNGERRAALHDPCAVLAVLEPGWFTFRARHVAVEVTGTLTRGMTVVDERARTLPANVEVAYEIDAAAALARIEAAFE